MTGEFVPGEIITTDGTITPNEGRETAEVTVGNTGDRPMQISSRFHFFEANTALSFDREAAYGMRLDIPTGTTIQLGFGDQTSVELVAIGGRRRAHGMNGMVNGNVDTDSSAAVERLRVAGFADTDAPDDKHGTAERSSE